jgi:hypothetical protein
LVMAGRARSMSGCGALAKSFLNLNDRNFGPDTENGHVNRRKLCSGLE